jgi:hypothetical protein
MKKTLVSPADSPAISTPELPANKTIEMPSVLHLDLVMLNPAVWLDDSESPLVTNNTVPGHVRRKDAS